MAVCAKLAVRFLTFFLVGVHSRCRCRCPPPTPRPTPPVSFAIAAYLTPLTGRQQQEGDHKVLRILRICVPLVRFYSLPFGVYHLGLQYTTNPLRRSVLVSVPRPRFYSVGGHTHATHARTTETNHRNQSLGQHKGVRGSSDPRPAGGVLPVPVRGRLRRAAAAHLPGEAAVPGPAAVRRGARAVGEAPGGSRGMYERGACVRSYACMDACGGGAFFECARRVVGSDGRRCDISRLHTAPCLCCISHRSRVFVFQSLREALLAVVDASISCSRGAKAALRSRCVKHPCAHARLEQKPPRLLHPIYVRCIEKQNCKSTGTDIGPHILVLCTDP